MTSERNLKRKYKDIIIIESDVELPNCQETLQKRNQNASTPKKSPDQLNNKTIIIEDSDSEMEQKEFPDVIKKMIAESVTLSSRKKKEILRWFKKNFNGSENGSAESPVANRKSLKRSGNSSSESNSGTPKKKRKLSESDKENDPAADLRHVQTGNLKKSHGKSTESSPDSSHHKDFNPSTSTNVIEIDPEDIIPPVSTKEKEQVHTEKQPGRISFLASLSKDVPLENADLEAIGYRDNYSTQKEKLCEVLYKLFNEKVFDNKLPEVMPIEWNDKLLSAAGKFKCKIVTHKSLEKTIQSPRIVLATTILNSSDRLRNTLIHEMCHAATRLISNNVSDKHGNVWKAWTSKAMEVFPELPTISRCHNYKTEKKYSYRCTCCGFLYRRHRRSFDLNRHQCRICHGPLELFSNTVTEMGKEQIKIAAATKKPTGFALYVRKNYRVVKQSGTSMKHSEIINILKRQFSAVEASA